MDGWIEKQEREREREGAPLAAARILLEVRARQNSLHRLVRHALLSSQPSLPATLHQPIHPMPAPSTARPSGSPLARTFIVTCKLISRRVHLRVRSSSGEGLPGKRRRRRGRGGGEVVRAQAAAAWLLVAPLEGAKRVVNHPTGGGVAGRLQHRALDLGAHGQALRVAAGAVCPRHSACQTWREFAVIEKCTGWPGAYGSGCIVKWHVDAACGLVNISPRV